MPPCKCTIPRPSEPENEWPWVVAHEKKEKKKGAGRRSLYPKCQQHGNPMHKFSDGSCTVPDELKPKYKFRKPKAMLEESECEESELFEHEDSEFEDLEDTPLSTLLTKRQAGRLQAPAPKRRATALEGAFGDADYQPRDSQAPQPGGPRLPFCMQKKAEQEAKSKPKLEREPRPEVIPAPEPFVYSADPLAKATSIMENEGVEKDGLLWIQVQAFYGAKVSIKR
ncbi:hypothetical protein E8E11_010615 [Didymella keratinophila]|nr:hypothetical protein E8E11_010615 [Didymella keratinophila]